MATLEIERALEFMAGRQLAHGELPSYRHVEPSLEGEGVLDSSPFVTSLVLHALADVDHPLAWQIVDRGVDFLIEERESPGVWRYWSSRNSSSIDPDLDDTCCCAHVLRRCGHPELVEGVDALVLGQRNHRGVFATWLREPQRANDVDSVVNANVLLLLGERAETQATIEILCRVIEVGRERDSTWYYLDPLALYYMISRAYAAGVRGFERVRGRIAANIEARQEADGSIGDELLTALAMSTLKNFACSEGPVIRRGLAHLRATQRPDGSWPARVFYAGPEPPGPYGVWWGAEVLTTGLCVEALSPGPAIKVELTPRYRRS